MSRIALVTSRALPLLDEDSRLLIPALARHGVEGVPCIWDDPEVAWSAFPLVVLRSPWDYYASPTAFLRWVDHVASASDLLNPPQVVRWNIDKRYLRQLASQGVPVVPTHWTEPQQPATWSDLPASWVQAGLVVKPVVSAGSADTWWLPAGGTLAWPQEVLDLLGSQPCMIQPFQPSILEVGELSLTFLEGSCSHAVRKVPAPGDFRSQEEWGAQIIPEVPPEELIALALRSLREVPGETAYARVDVMFDAEGQPMVGEVEVTEPGLYLAASPGSADRLAGCLAARLLGRVG